MVLMSMTSWPGCEFSKMPSSPIATATTSGESGTMVITTSEPLTASAMLDAPRPPAATSASTRFALRL